jgi:streptogramin lyase
MKLRVLTNGLVLVALIVSWMIGPLAGTSTAEVSGTNVLYTTDADFEHGILVSVNHDAPKNNQLQLNQPTEPFPFVNVAASGRGTMVRINAETSEIVGEYRTAPEGRGLDPSRTTVDLFGNVWTGNRGESGLIDGVPHGSVVKIGLAIGGVRVNADGTPNPLGDYLAPPFGYNTCVDRDGDGLLKTSRGLGDIRPWPDVTDGVGGVDSIVEDAEDECILIYQRLPQVLEIRHVSVDANNDVWVGDAFSRLAPGFHKLDGNTGTILASPERETIRCGGYGGLVDGNGILWSASRGPLLRYDPATDTGTCIGVSDSYGMGIDANGFIWISQWPNLIVKVSPAGVVETGFPKPTGGFGGEARGVAVTPADNHVWVANSQSNTVSRLNNDGNLLKVIAVGGFPTGVAVDAGGKVWVTNGSDSVMRIDPDGGADGLGAVELIVDLGPGAWPYNYSDMTGMVVVGSTSPQGIWTVVQDSGTSGFEWGAITWNTEPEGSEPPGTAIVVETRTADTEAGLGGASFQVVSNGDFFSLFGRFIEVRVTLKAAADGTGPVLSDIRIQSAAVVMEIDIKPGSCPNPFDTKSKGVLPVAVLGTEDFDVTAIDPDTIQLTREGYEVGVFPLRWSYEDVATPFEGEPCECHELNDDGYLDLSLKFDTQEVKDTLELKAEVGNTIPLLITGNLMEDAGGTPIEGADCIWVLRTGEK